jgi:hypothetical protein
MVNEDQNRVKKFYPIIWAFLQQQQIKRIDVTQRLYTRIRKILVRDLVWTPAMLSFFP